MSRLRGVRASESGLTLVETLVAMLIFAIMTVGIVPLLGSALGGAALGRTLTVGKNLTTQAMERARGLPYFESVQGQTTPTRRDLLDLYFPDRGTGFSSSANTFTTTCTSTSSTPSVSGALACPSTVPTGYTLAFVTAFVQPGPTPPTTSPPTAQTYTVVAPPTGYSWSSTSTEVAPTQLLRVGITASWSYGGKSRSFSLTSLLGQRHLSDETIDGTGASDYALQVLTSYADAQGRTSELVATAGESESSIVSRTISEADESTRAAHLVLTQNEAGDTSSVTLADIAGASAFVHAPPNSYPTANASAAEQTAILQYDATTQVPVAFTDDTIVEQPSSYLLGAQVVNELPLSAGKYRFTGAAGANQPSLWVDNQADRGSTSPLKLDTSAHLVTLDRDGTNRMLGQTSAQATAISPISLRKVETKSSAQFGKLFVLPTTFISSSDKAVVTISNFSASLTCTSTANASTAAVAGTWSATLSYWKDPVNDGLPTVAGNPSGYVNVALSGSLTGGSDPLAAVKAANPLVYDDAVNSNDVYLFDVPSANQKGYFKDLSSRPSISSTKNGSGRNTTANINGAIQIQTVPTSASNASTGITISVGKLSCEAVDKRA